MALHDGGPAFALSRSRWLVDLSRITVVSRALQEPFGLNDEAFANERVDGTVQCGGDVRSSSVPPEEATDLGRELVSADTPGVVDNVPHRELCLSARDLRRRPLRQLVASRHSDYLELARMRIRIRPLCAADQATATEAFQGGLERVTDPITRACDSPHASRTRRSSSSSSMGPSTSTTSMIIRRRSYCASGKCISTHGRGPAGEATRYATVQLGALSSATSSKDCSRGGALAATFGGGPVGWSPLSEIAAAIAALSRSSCSDR
jgi:hypothetical protein